MLDIILKNKLKKNLKENILLIDLGTDNSKISVNYPDYAHKLCKKLVKIVKIWVF